MKANDEFNELTNNDIIEMRTQAEVTEEQEVKDGRKNLIPPLSRVPDD